MKKIAFLLAFLAFSPASGADITFSRGTLAIQTSNHIHHYDIEIAQTHEQQEQGLMDRKHVGKDEGMLFWQETERVMHMWMYNTYIPLDMLFIDSMGKIIYIARNAKPHSLNTIGPERPVRAVLELAGGSVVARGIKLGDQVMYKGFEE